jgi:predicted short-subunit dehydrogenase-like oxidoreductase (DUF2520 family)
MDGPASATLLRRRVYVIGAGRVGRALVRELLAIDVPVVGAWNRQPETAAETAALLQVPTRSGALPDTREAEIVLLTVPDRWIGRVAGALIEKGYVYPTQVLLHCSGALPAAVMRVHPERPAGVGCLHPLQTFAPGRQAPGTYFMTVEGEELAVQTATALARRLGHPTLRIGADAKVLYHAGATIAANYLVTLENAAADLLARAGVPYRTALRALGELLHTAVDNLVAQGPAAALTGPIARGDREVVARHLTVLRQEAPDLVELYQLLGRYTLALATGSGNPVPNAAHLRRLLLPDED